MRPFTPIDRTYNHLHSSIYYLTEGQKDSVQCDAFIAWLHSTFGVAGILKALKHKIHVGEGITTSEAYLRLQQTLHQYDYRFDIDGAELIPMQTHPSQHTTSLGKVETPTSAPVSEHVIKAECSDGRPDVEMRTDDTEMRDTCDDDTPNAKRLRLDTEDIEDVQRLVVNLEDSMDHEYDDDRDAVGVDVSVEMLRSSTGYSDNLKLQPFIDVKYTSPFTQ